MQQLALLWFSENSLMFIFIACCIIELGTEKYIQTVVFYSKRNEGLPLYVRKLIWLKTD